MGLLAYEKENLTKVRRMAPECTLFLKRNCDFPIDEPCKVALFGNGARKTIRGGTGSGEVNSRFAINAEQGLEQEGFTITTRNWIDAFDDIHEKAEEAFYDEIKRKAKENHTFAVMESMGKIMPQPEYSLSTDYEGDIAVYVLSRISGEGSDREFKKGDILLTDTEVRDILAINKKFDKFMLVLNVGGPVDLSPVMEVENILLLSQLGVVTGKTLARIILGKDVPSGKLTTTWAKEEDYCKKGTFGDKNDTYYKEGIYVGYRYFNTVDKKAVFPFGYGLGFTDFEVNPMDISMVNTTVTVKAEVKNTGKYKGKEVVQVYVSVPDGELDQPYQSLAAFKKTPVLNSGDTAVLSISFDISDIAGYDSKKAAYVLESGAYVVRVGNSSESTKVAGVIDIEESAVIRKVKNCLGEFGFEDWVPENKKAVEIPVGSKHITFDGRIIKTEETDYEREYEKDSYISSLSNKELAKLCVGAYKEHGIANTIGDASMKVAGAAGQTSTPKKNGNFPYLVMADGPAGIRICKQYYIDKDGNEHPVGVMMMDSLLRLMPKIGVAFLKLRAKRPPKSAIKFHYATAVPIGVALAQSFNVMLAKECGNIVGGEMERFGIHLWLAPALNIHRDIRCGRNFEYFSEDPLVSGLFAAAITEGVQAHPGCGTTIKHYAANNQETNRYNSNSHVSERAMREIYLKGFEICVKKSQPLTLMTSYNLLNGEHTSESRALIEDILRSEFGFKGVVMTDWVVMGGTIDKSSMYRAPKAGLVVKAGGDLFMPGCEEDVESILEHLKSGEITREQLIINGTRIYRLAKECNEKQILRF